MLAPAAPIPSPDYTPATPHTDEESEPMEASKTRVATPHSTTSPSDSTSPLSPDHPLTQTSLTPTPSRASYYRCTARMAVRTQPTLSPGLSARVTEEMTLSPLSFRKRYGSSYETPSTSASPASSSTLPSRKRYRGTSKLIEDTEVEDTESETKREESEDEGPDSESKEAASKDQQQQAVSVEDTAVDEPLGLGYEAARRRDLELAGGSTHNTYEDPMDGTVYTDIECVIPPVCAPVQTPASPEWSSGSLPVSLASLTILTLVATPASVKPVDEGFLAELGADIKLHGGAGAGYHYFWYEDQREIHALRMQHAADQREMQELRDRVAALERRMDRLEE
ncbi:hypothetical protein Tco_0282206 [Tanacetum coccineum]